MESGAKGCEVVVSGKLRGQRAKSMKFVDGLMIHSGEPTKHYVDEAIRHVYLRQGKYCYGGGGSEEGNDGGGDDKVHSSHTVGYGGHVRIVMVQTIHGPVCLYCQNNGEAWWSLCSGLLCYCLTSGSSGFFT